MFNVPGPLTIIVPRFVTYEILDVASGRPISVLPFIISVAPRLLTSVGLDFRYRRESPPAIVIVAPGMLRTSAQQTSVSETPLADPSASAPEFSKNTAFSNVVDASSEPV